MSLEKITIIGWLLLLVALGFMVGKIIYNTIKAERTRKKFLPTMKQGDTVRFPVASGSVGGEILEVNGDTVKVIVNVSKSRVYPENS